MYNGIYNDDVNRFYESVVWTHKIQRTYLESLEKRRKILSILEIVFTAASSVSTTVFALLGNNIGTIVSSIITLLSLVFASILEKVETKKDIDSFRKSSGSLWILKCRVERLSHEIKGNILSDEEVSRNIEMLQLSFDNATSSLPTVPNRIVDIASHKLKDRKDEEVEMKIV